MPWKVSGVVERRKQFLAEYEAGESTMWDLCRAYGISRQTGYEVLRRYQSGGEATAEDAPLHPAVRVGACAQPGVVRGLQGLVPHRRWRAHRSVDHHRRLQSVSAALPGGGKDGPSAGAGHL